LQALPHGLSLNITAVGPGPPRGPSQVPPWCFSKSCIYNLASANGAHIPSCPRGVFYCFPPQMFVFFFSLAPSLEQLASRLPMKAFAFPLCGGLIKFYFRVFFSKQFFCNLFLPFSFRHSLYSPLNPFFFLRPSQPHRAREMQQAPLNGEPPILFRKPEAFLEREKRFFFDAPRGLWGPVWTLPDEQGARQLFLRREIFRFKSLPAPKQNVWVMERFLRHGERPSAPLPGCGQGQNLPKAKIFAPARKNYFEKHATPSPLAPLGGRPAPASLPFPRPIKNMGAPLNGKWGEIFCFSTQVRTGGWLCAPLGFIN